MSKRNPIDELTSDDALVVAGAGCIVRREKSHGGNVHIVSNLQCVEEWKVVIVGTSQGRVRFVRQASLPARRLASLRSTINIEPHRTRSMSGHATPVIPGHRP